MNTKDILRNRGENVKIRGGSISIGADTENCKKNAPAKRGQKPSPKGQTPLVRGRWRVAPDEGRSLRGSPVMGNNGNFAPHQSPSATASPSGEAFMAATHLRVTILKVSLPTFFSKKVGYRFVYPISFSSTTAAVSRPSRNAQTTRLWPRRMSPQAKTFGSAVAYFTSATVPRFVRSTPNASAT